MANFMGRQAYRDNENLTSDEDRKPNREHFLEFLVFSVKVEELCELRDTTVKSRGYFYSRKQRFSTRLGRKCKIYLVK